MNLSFQIIYSTFLHNYKEPNNMKLNLLIAFLLFIGITYSQNNTTGYFGRRMFVSLSTNVSTPLIHDLFIKSYDELESREYNTFKNNDLNSHNFSLVGRVGLGLEYALKRKIMLGGSFGFQKDKTLKMINSVRLEGVPGYKGYREYDSFEFNTYKVNVYLGYTDWFDAILPVGINARVGLEYVRGLFINKEYNYIEFIPQSSNNGEFISGKNRPFEVIPEPHIKGNHLAITYSAIVTLPINKRFLFSYGLNLVLPVSSLVSINEDKEYLTPEAAKINWRKRQVTSFMNAQFAISYALF